MNEAKISVKPHAVLMFCNHAVFFRDLMVSLPMHQESYAYIPTHQVRHANMTNSAMITRALLAYVLVNALTENVVHINYNCLVSTNQMANIIYVK